MACQSSCIVSPATSVATKKRRASASGSSRPAEISQSPPRLPVAKNFRPLTE
jgi:hypothetical protein